MPSLKGRYMQYNIVINVPAEVIHNYQLIIKAINIVSM